MSIFETTLLVYPFSRRIQAFICVVIISINQGIQVRFDAEDIQKLGAHIRSENLAFEGVSENEVQWAYDDGTTVTALYNGDGTTLREALTETGVEDADRDGWCVLIDWSWGDQTVPSMYKTHRWSSVLNIVACTGRAIRDYSLNEPSQTDAPTIGDSDFDPMRFTPSPRASYEFEKTEERATGRFDLGIKQMPNNPCEAYPWVHVRDYRLLYDYRGRFPEGTLLDGSTIHDGHGAYRGTVEPDDTYIVVSVDSGAPVFEKLMEFTPEWLTYAEEDEYVESRGIRFGTRVKLVREYEVMTVTLTGANLKPKNVRDAGYDMLPKAGVTGYGDLCTARDEETGETIVFDGGEIVAVENVNDLTVSRSKYWGELEDPDIVGDYRFGYDRYERSCKQYDYEGRSRPAVHATTEFDTSYRRATEVPRTPSPSDD